MCSWCWAFRPVWTEVQQALPESIQVKYLLGGLAPDSDAPMPAETQAMIRRHWQTIEQRAPGTEFNYDFWSDCTPRRSTYPACRAVIAARLQQPDIEDDMIRRIQQAYYLHARNPSDDGVLTDLASDMGLDIGRFRHDLNADATQALLAAEIRTAQGMGVQGFPSLIMAHGDHFQSIPVDYNHAEVILRHISQAMRD